MQPTIFADKGVSYLSGAFREPVTPYLVFHVPAIGPDEQEMRCKTTTFRKS